MQLTAANFQYCSKSGEKFKSVIPEREVKILDLIEEPNQDVQLDFPGPLTSVWGANKYILIFVDSFCSFPMIQITTRTMADVIKDFMENYTF